MSNFFTRQSAAFKNDLNRSLGALVGIAQGLICDGHLNDQEIQFLESWLSANENISLTWPGDVVHARIKQVLADGVVTQEERDHLLLTLQQLIGGNLDDLAAATHVTELGFDNATEITFVGKTFCLTGEFVFAPRTRCAEEIEKRGGLLRNSVTRKLDHLVIGSLGSPEWKHGSFGTKIEGAMALKREGSSLLLIREDDWASALSRHPIA